VKTRKCPGGFNETRHIAFTNYTAIIIWLAFVPLYLASTSNSIRVVTLAISLSLRYYIILQQTHKFNQPHRTDLEAVNIIILQELRKKQSHGSGTERYVKGGEKSLDLSKW
jgi:hypothetical protein